MMYALIYIHFVIIFPQTLKKRERDFEAERDLLMISNNTIKQRLLVLKKEVVIRQELSKASSPEAGNAKAGQPLGESTSPKSAVKLKSMENQASPVSVATQTSFTSGDESDADGFSAKLESVQVEAVSNGEVEHSDGGKEEACIDDEDEDVDVEGEITDDNTEDVDSLIKDDKAVKSKVVKSPEPVPSAGRSSANKRKAASGDDGNKLEAKKSNIQCCARVSC